MKYILYCLVLLATFSNIITIKAQLPENGLIGYYPFNGNANDRSGNCTHGAVKGADLAIDRLNYSDAAYHFNGTNNKYIEIPGASFENNEYSYSIWAQPESIPPTGEFNTILSLGGSDFKDQGIYIRNEVYGCGGYNSNATNNILYSVTPPVIGKWTHLVSVRSKDKAQLYVDGQLANEITISETLTPFYSSNLIMTLGIRHLLTNPFNGSLDDARVYNRALTASEVEDLYNEHLCYESIKVIDTLVINANITSYNPVIYNVNIKVFPNPTLDHLIIDAGNITDLSGFSFKITNAAGLEVFQSLIDKPTFDLDMNKWKGKGLYLLYLYDANLNIVDVKKILLQ